MKFHFEHNVTPKHVAALLALFGSEKALDKEAIRDRLKANAHSISDDYLGRNLVMLVNIGSLRKVGASFELSELGDRLARLLQFRPNIFFDLMHYLYHATWDENPSEQVAFSWTYQNICDILWASRPSKIDGNAVANEIYRRIEREFSQVQKSSISHWAVQGVCNWLAALDPPFMKPGTKNHSSEGRHACSPELIILAIDYLYRKNGIPYGTTLLLDEPKITAITAFCLLHPASFEPMLETTLNSFSVLKCQSTLWGRSLLLPQPVSILTVS